MKGKRLEQYTIRRPQEVLIVHIQVAGEEEQVAIFKGFSSSLTHPTAFDPDIPVLPEQGTITAIDRVASPYNPEKPHFLQQGLTWEEMEHFLAEFGI